MADVSLRSLPFLLIPLSACWLGFNGFLSAQTENLSDEVKILHFEKHVRPALAKYCYECHSHETEANGGLLLDSKTGWQKGGDSGPALIPGKLLESRIIQAIRYEDTKLQMPPEKKLPSEVIKAIEDWVSDGAVDPRSEVKEVAKKKPSMEAAQSHWAYQPLSIPLLLENSGRSKGAIDAFVDQKLQAVGIEGTGLADRLDQVKRLHLDLTGLPPTLETLRRLDASEDFERDYSQLVDELMASPGYGEAFARRWMDVARYAESVTLRGLVFKEAWRFRDYLIRAYSQDRPFNQMILEQVAGDLLKEEDHQARWDQLVATTFMAMGNTNFEEQDKQQLEMDYVDEQLDVIGQAFLGQTIGCARCHDHKFDPIPTQDYYAMAGILKSAVALRHSNVSNWIDQPLPLSPEEESIYSKLEKEMEGVNKELASKKKQIATFAKKSEKSKSASTSGPKENTDDRPASAAPEKTAEVESSIESENRMKILEQEVKGLEARQKELQVEVDRRPRYLAIVEEAPPQDIAVHVRGDVHNLGPVVPRGFLSAIRMTQPIHIMKGQSGRLEFAQWIGSEENPLTPRVYANRVWSWLMGQGLVDSINNFGTTGNTPTHPELLDWLASELRRSGWSTKHLVRLIVHSNAYRRRTGEPTEHIKTLDPDNRLYWSAHRRRLTAEELRDAMLQASGELDFVRGGSMIPSTTKADNGYRHGSTRRSIYHPVFRNALPELFDAFDFASSSLPVGQRTRSTVATQSLTLINSPWIQERAKATANRIRTALSQSIPDEYIHSAYQLCLQREPTSEELTICREFFADDVPERYPEQLERLVHALFASIDFRYLQ